MIFVCIIVVVPFYYCLYKEIEVIDFNSLYDFGPEQKVCEAFKKTPSF